jgi:hypothetical protein
MQRIVTVTRTRPPGRAHAADLGWGRSPKLHGMQEVKVDAEAQVLKGTGQR